MSKKRISYDRVVEVRILLRQIFPDTFRGFKEPKLPLKVGIGFDIKVALPELSWRAINGALSDYARGPTYLGALKAGAPRFNLKGEPDGIVTPEAAAIAAADYAKAVAWRAKARARREAEAAAVDKDAKEDA
jgi:sRNA-binding protein